MNKLDLLGNKILFKEPSTKVLTNTIIDAVDSAIPSFDIYPHAHTATLQDIWTEALLYGTATDITLTSGFRYCFGLFLPSIINTNESVQPNMLYSMSGSLQFLAGTTTAHRCYFIFGRSASATVTASDAAASNLLSDYVILPANNGGQGDLNLAEQANKTTVRRSISQEVLLVNNGENNPVVFGCVIECPFTAGTLEQFQLSMTFRRNIATIDTYRPAGI